MHCHIERVDVQRTGEESMEAAARRLRYQSLAAQIRPEDVLLTAHHEDDQAETVLLQLLRGAGVHGLAAMPAMQPFSAGLHARPLLGFSRAALRDYAQAEQLVWIDDTSNANEHMSRNFLRARVLPLLQQRWPAAARTLARAAGNSADAVALLDEVGATDLVASVSPDGARLLLPALRALAPARRRNLVRYWIRARGFHAPAAQHLDQILALVDRPPESGQACIDWPEAELHLYRDELAIRERLPLPGSRLELAWAPTQSLEIPGTGWRLRAAPGTGAGLSQAKLAGLRLTVRLRRGGETCQLAGHTHHRKLKKLLQEEGVPPWERGRLPLIYADGELAAIGDRWVCASFAAQPYEPSWQIVLDAID